MKKTFLFATIILSLILIISCQPEVKHEHKWGEWTVSKEATCTESGISIRKCISCGEQDEETSQIKALGHKLGETATTVDKAATCGEDGSETYSCTRKGCDYTEKKTVPATGKHTYGDEQTKAATCTEDGKKYQICSVCDNEKVNEVIEALGHKLGETATTVTKAATCGKDGSETYSCTREGCDYTEKKTIPATGKHTYGEEKTKDATCTEDGKKYQICSVCNNEKVNEVITASGHIWSPTGTVKTAATCQKKGVTTYSCTKCDTTKDEEDIAIDPNKHVDYSWVKDETTAQKSYVSNKVTEKKICVCGHDSKETREVSGEYKSVIGFWESDLVDEQFTETTDSETISKKCSLKMYLSFLDESNLIIDAYEKYSWTMSCGGNIEYSGTNESISETICNTYSWITDENGTRTGLRTIYSDEETGKEFDYTIKVSEKRDDNGTISLLLIIPNPFVEPSTEGEEGEEGEVSTDSIVFTLTQKTHTPHTHTYENCTYDENIANHTADTSCKEHEKLSITGNHVYEDEKSTICSICGQKRVYIIRYYMKNGDTVASSFDAVKMSDSYTLPEQLIIYTFEEIDGVTWGMYPSGTYIITKYTDKASGNTYNSKEKLIINKDMEFIFEGTPQQTTSGGESYSGYSE